MAITGKQLYLIEVKNYMDRNGSDEHIPIESLRENPEKYAEEFIQKFEDSIHLIRIINKYYHRQLWYKFLWRPFSRLLNSRKRLGWNPGFWTKAFRLHNKKNITFILWLEPGPDINQKESKLLFEKINLYFGDYFKESGQHILIMNGESHQDLFDVKPL